MWGAWGAPLGSAGTPSLLSPPCFPQANDTVVELAQELGLEQAVDTMRLRLLVPPQPHDRFHALQPPLAGP